MATGIVKYYNNDKGFGFIARDDDGEDIFVHHSDIEGGGYRYLLRGEPVEFADYEDQKTGKIKAVKVRPRTGRQFGVVANFDHQKGFGFIRPDDESENVFFHHSDILSSGAGRTTAEEGERVQYDLGPGSDGRVRAIRIKREDSRPPLLRFADLGPEERWLNSLSSKAETEPWNYLANPLPQSSYPVLKNYLLHTFGRLESEDADQPGKKIAVGRAGNVPYSCFNTGLVTPNQEEIYALFVGKDTGKDGRRWRLSGFHAESDHEMLSKFESFPELANYFDDPAVLLYDRRCELYMDIDHIINDNIARFPGELRENRHLARQALIAARAETQKRVFRNYKTAVPQFHRGSVQLLLPLCLVQPGKADLALVVSRKSSQDRQYRGETVLTLDMAYNNARLLCRPDSDWLRP
ncbi:DUF3825 domain-containing protein [Nonomuraea sp. MTCD27]|uniref:DUF3825 domain-containing protein n=1 Tax=Nonomuraea sp. MTCD27 TaxID=1676747 RepID=UPI0035C0FF75